MSQLGLGSRLRNLRHERGLTQQQLAVKAGLAVATYTRLETAHPQPGRPGGTTLATLEKLARALDVPISALVDGTNGSINEPAAHPA
jgi:transcriptional regulator with XRE-family HTH domain